MKELENKEMPCKLTSPKLIPTGTDGRQDHPLFSWNLLVAFQSSRTARQMIPPRRRLTSRQGITVAAWSLPRWKKYTGKDQLTSNVTARTPRI
jgi:hypothetical protein